MLAGAATVFALLSAWHSVGHMRRILGEERATYSAMTPTERRRLPVTHATLDGQIFDFYADFLVKGDRVYLQVMPSGFSPAFDLPKEVLSMSDTKVQGPERLRGHRREAAPYEGSLILVRQVRLT